MNDIHLTIHIFAVIDDIIKSIEIDSYKHLNGMRAFSKWFEIFKVWFAISAKNIGELRKNCQDK